MNIWKKVYGICFFAACLCPSVGMLWAQTDTTSENRTLSEVPQIKTEEGWNINWLSELGNYFQEHFAYRQELVTANAVLKGKGMGVSTVSSVIQGEKNWLYYSDSLRDYLGTEPLSDRGLYNIAHSLRLMQENLDSRGVKFLFTIAPNKNSLYGENMPYYDSLKVSEETNRERLALVLAEEGVRYADLYAFFSSQDEVLYHERDSHWNNKGAMLAGDILLTQLGKEHTDYETESFEIRKDFEGDLDKMLYPLDMTPENEIYYEKEFTYTYEGEVGSNFDPKITTTNSIREGSLVMYRDSFGNALLPFLADEYGAAYFSRGVPYQLNDVDMHQADTVLVERAERFLPDMAKNPPVLAAAELRDDFLGEQDVAVEASEVQIVPQGLVYKITGKLPAESMGNKTNIFLRIDQEKIYEAFPMDYEENGETSSYGFCLYVPAESGVTESSLTEVFLSEKCSTGNEKSSPVEELTDIGNNINNESDTENTGGAVMG